MSRTLGPDEAAYYLIGGKSHTEVFAAVQPDGIVVLWRAGMPGHVPIEGDQIHPLIEFLQKHAPKAEAQAATPGGSSEELLSEAIHSLVQYGSNRQDGSWYGAEEAVSAIKSYGDARAEEALEGARTPAARPQEPEPADDGEDIVGIAMVLRDLRKRGPGSTNDALWTAKLRDAVLADHGLTGRTVERLMTSGNADDDELATLISYETGMALDPEPQGGEEVVNG